MFPRLLGASSSWPCPAESGLDSDLNLNLDLDLDPTHALGHERMLVFLSRPLRASGDAMAGKTECRDDIRRPQPYVFLSRVCSMARAVFLLSGARVFYRFFMLIYVLMSSGCS